MTTIENKYKRRLMTAMKHVLPELKMAEEGAKISATDVANIKLLVEHDNHANRRRVEELVQNNEVFKPYYNCTLDEQREHAYRRLQAFCQAGIISVADFEQNPMNIFMAHEKFGEVDGSFATKMTVQFNLFGGTVYRLGSEAHREFFAKKIDNSEIVGCFGLSELGYGNNAVEMETTSTYDADKQEFIINSPSVLSQKYWITNGACHAHYCVVFAQLISKGEHQGVHGFLVPIREQGTLKEMPGCRVEDMGMKIGLNGIDNAKILFNNVRVPRENMLTSYAHVEKDGTYVWKDGKAPKLRDRFLRLADQLLSGRVCISSMMVGATKVVMTGTLMYLSTRMGVGASGKSDTAILEYQLCQHEIFPLVARTFATQFYHNYVKRAYDQRTTLAMSGSDPVALEKQHKELIILCSSVKPIAAWLCDKSVVTCRERVGGVGFLEANGFGGMFAHAGITAEGDARVLCAKVTKELLDILQQGTFTDRLKDIAEPPAMPKVCFDKITSLAESEDGKQVVDECCLTLETLFAHRVNCCAEDLKTKLMAYVTKEQEAGRKFRYVVYDANLKMFSDEIQAVAASYGQWESLRAFNQVLKSGGADPELLHRSPGTKLHNGGLSNQGVAILGRLAVLYALDVMQEDVEGCLKAGVLNANQVGRLKEVKAVYCKAIRPDIMVLVKGLGVDVTTQYRPIGKDWKEFNKADNFGEVVDTGRYLTDKV